MLDNQKIRDDFPILKQTNPFGQPLIYLDNAATTQKPKQVLDAIQYYYTHFNANIHRGGYWPATQATSAYEDTRKKVAEFLNAHSERSIVFTSGTTDSINKLAGSFLEPKLKHGDEVIISQIEHHSNLVPWQQLCLKKGAHLKYMPANDRGILDLETYSKLLNPKTKLVAVTAVSNTLGINNPIENIISLAHQFDVPVFVDGAQMVPHSRTDVSQLNCDFLAFSAHKIYGPTGIGVLYGKTQLLENMEPLQYGGGMITEVTYEDTLFAESPRKHEAGTPNISGVIGLGAAIDFLNELGFEQIQAHNSDLVQYAVEKLSELPGIQLIGDTKNHAPVLSFNLEGIHPHDVAGFLNEDGISIRAGHHCTQPLMELLHIHGTCRISFAVYNTRDEIDQLIDSLKRVWSFFK